MRARDSFWSRFSKPFFPKPDYETLAIKCSPPFSKCFIKEVCGEEVWKNRIVLVPVELIFGNSASGLCSRHTLMEAYERLMNLIGVCGTNVRNVVHFFLPSAFF